MCNNHSESGQPCGFEPCEAFNRMKSQYAATNLSLCEINKERRDDIERLEAENAALRQERDDLIQVSADVCPDCGWAMKFPDEPCRNCEVVALRKVVEKADALADFLNKKSLGDETIKHLVAYQEARHAKD